MPNFEDLELRALTKNRPFRLIDQLDPTQHAPLVPRREVWHNVKDEQTCVLRERETALLAKRLSWQAPAQKCRTALLCAQVPAAILDSTQILLLEVASLHSSCAYTPTRLYALSAQPSSPGPSCLTNFNAERGQLWYYLVLHLGRHLTALKFSTYYITPPPRKYEWHRLHPGTIWRYGQQKLL